MAIKLFVYENRAHKLISPRRFAERLGRHTLLAFALLTPALAIGTLGFHMTEDQAWLDAFMQASMLLSGMGPTAIPSHPIGKVFASCYALASGLFLLTAAAVIVAPVAHRVLHHFHATE
jgi:hypothetical protein